MSKNWVATGGSFERDKYSSGLRKLLLPNSSCDESDHDITGKHLRICHGQQYPLCRELIF